jgi:hypothetical protein
MNAASIIAFVSRPLPLMAGIVLVAAASPASAQTTIRMTTVAGQSCVAVTDANGLTLVPGSTDLQATGVTLTGPGCGGATPPPTSPNGLQLAASPASPTAGQGFQVSWTVSNATSCVGTVTSGSAANVAGWTQTTSPASPRAVTIAVAGNYTLQLSCTNGTSAPLESPPLPLVVQAGGGGDQSCPGPDGLTRLTTSDISYGLYPQVRAGVDVREWNNIWGHYTSTDAVHPWPGISGAEPMIRNFGRTNFVAAHFNTGATGVGVGNYLFNVNLPGPNIDMSISTTCGDFSANAANPACSVTNIVSADTSTLYWNFTGGSPNFKCQLAPNTDYYLNIKLTDPNSTMECARGNPTCPIATTHYVTP